MDMTRHLRRLLNDGELRKMGGWYEGIIAEVIEESVRNRFTGQRSQEPVIVFDDGWRLIPNLSMRRALIELFGADSGDWIGQRVTVFRQEVESPNRQTGQITRRWEKRIMRTEVPRVVGLSKNRGVR